MGTGKGWSAEESAAACKAYIKASEDSRQGSGKKKDVFEGEVLVAYTELLTAMLEDDEKSYTERTGDAIIQRCRKARCECLTFECIVAAIKAKKPTGAPNENEIERDDLAVYNGESIIGNMYTFFMDATIDLGPPFVFKDALEYLRTTSTWYLVLLSKQAAKEKRKHIEGIPVITGSSLSSLGDTTGIPAPAPISDSGTVGSEYGFVTPKKERPVGTKRALEV